MDKLKNYFKSYFSNGPKAVFIVMLILIGTTIFIDAARKTIVVSIDGNETKITTFRNTFKDILKANDIVLGPKDKAIPSIDTKVNKNDRIDIKRAVNVIVLVDGQQKNIQTTEDTVDKMLESEGIVLTELDRITPSREIPIENGLELTVTRVEAKVIDENHPVEYATEVRKDEDSEKGSTKILQDGQTGERLISTKIVYEDGKEVSREVIKDVITKEPVQKIVSVGTLAALNLSRGGGKALYKSAIKARATAYTADFASTGKRPGDSGFARTASGTTVRRNPDGYSSIAVDPSVIPLGTKLYVEGYGYAIAEDTGGAIKGNTIDVFFDTAAECTQWGVKYVNVYILK